MARVVHGQLPPGPRAGEALDRRERHGLVVPAGVDERRRRRIGLFRVAARVVQQIDRQRQVAPQAVVVDGRGSVLPPACERGRPDACLPARGEAEGRGEENEAAHAVGRAGGGERGQVAAEARAEEHGRPAREDRLDHGEHAGHRHVREVGREVGDLQRDAVRCDSPAEELRLGAAGAGSEAVEVREGHRVGFMPARVARRQVRRTDTPAPPGSTRAKGRTNATPRRY